MCTRCFHLCALQLTGASGAARIGDRGLGDLNDLSCAGGECEREERPFKEEKRRGIEVRGPLCDRRLGLGRARLVALRVQHVCERAR
jgi:hypothetical protein